MADGSLATAGDRVTDGNTGTRLSCGDVGRYWVQFDAGSAVSGDGVRYRSDWWEKALENFEFCVSDDPAVTADSGATLLYTRVAGLPLMGAPDDQDNQTFYFDAAGSGRFGYFRIIDTHDANTLSLPIRRAAADGRLPL
ncbi:MAG: hypothetical protein ACJAYU_002497 [Bradymonadia bacterium]